MLKKQHHSKRGRLLLVSKGGITQSSININDTSGELGVYLGLFSETRFTEKWSLQTELLYSFLDFDMDNTNESLLFLIEDGIGLFEVPILAKYYITKKVSVLADPKLGFNTSGNTNLALDAGLQWDFSDKFFVEGRYSQDFLTFGNDSSNNETSLGLFKLGVGFKF